MLIKNGYLTSNDSCTTNRRGEA
ncbi:hypothetical protein RDI58_024627 [Solanum bulbocastanum]|uniref:Uncharacterized protein n=1 Tax=Solanum bulbocastanum TaxID=147425 RepID=A0AAN8Y3I2_SOLBU